MKDSNLFLRTVIRNTSRSRDRQKERKVANGVKRQIFSSKSKGRVVFNQQPRDSGERVRSWL